MHAKPNACKSHAGDRQPQQLLSDPLLKGREGCMVKSSLHPQVTPAWLLVRAVAASNLNV